MDRVNIGCWITKMLYTLYYTSYMCRELEELTKNDNKLNLTPINDFMSLKNETMDGIRTHDLLV